jgi:hypothetical protein
VRKFTELTAREREDIFRNLRTAEFLIDERTLGFEDIEAVLTGIDTYKYFEMPRIADDNKTLFQILSFAPPNNKGLWIKVMIRTYLEGGTIFYKRIDENNFIVTITFKEKRTLYNEGMF